MTWSRAFIEPIPLPSGTALRTLQEAADYVLALPEAEQRQPHWQAAVEALILVAEHGGDTLLARIGMTRALNGVAPGTAKVKLPPRLIR